VNPYRIPPQVTAKDPVNVHVHHDGDRIVSLCITDDHHEAPLAKIYAGIRATYILNALMWITIAAIGIHLAGCTSPMSAFEADVGEACQAREQERTAAGCGPEVYPEGPCEAKVAAAERCWGPAERLWWCEAGAEWACWPWGATTGSQCEVEYVEMRDCMRGGGA
jgi:hypothetical protein